MCIRDRDQIYNIYLDSLCQLIYSVVLVYPYQKIDNKQIYIGLYNRYVILSFIKELNFDDYTIRVVIYPNDIKRIKYVKDYLQMLNLKSHIVKDEMVTYIMYLSENKSLNLYKFTYFIKNLIHFQDYKVKLSYYDSDTNKRINLNNMEADRLYKDGYLLNLYKNIDDVFHPTKYDIINILDYIGSAVGLFSENESNVQNDLALKYSYLFKNKDFINFLRNIL